MNAIGVDVGGTKIAAAVVSPEGEILNEVRYPTQAVPPDRLDGDHRRGDHGGEGRLRGGRGVPGGSRPHPGLGNKVIFAPNLHEIENIRLDEEIGSRTGMRVTVENDANAAAWGEFRYGAGKDVEHQVFITLGTGVGGGVITHGVAPQGRPGRGRGAGARDPRPDGTALRLRQPRLPRGARLWHRHRAPRAGGRQRAANSALGRLAIERQVLGEDVTGSPRKGTRRRISSWRRRAGGWASAWRGS